ncbi:MAG TPA: GGDEF domain-containing protein [Candidatus Limnocylindria bacterium]|nr:GGDEF domain-containing protein [Candidatus Limnocylindria bacterium]
MTIRAARVVATVAAAAVPFAVVAMLQGAPPIAVEDVGPAWLAPTALALLAATAAAATIAWLARGMRSASLTDLLSAGASASIAGGSITALASGAGLTAPVAASAALLAVGVAVERIRLPHRGSAIAAAAAGFAVAEASVVAEVLPSTAAAIAAARPAILLVALGLAGAAAVTRLTGGGVVAWLIGLAAAGLLADRGGSVESIVALAALLGSQLLAARDALEPRSEVVESTDVSLPDLASQLPDAILRFDGHLRLRDWNGAATSLLGLHSDATGTRMEDLLGIPLSELPALEASSTSRTVVGGLEVAMHRSGLGVTAVIRDPGAAPEAERLATELRSTIEELLRARRTIDLQRGELERSATVDPLTGVASRGAILERLRLEVAQVRRYRHPLAVVLLDIDDFGSINRVHGIGGGDAVLREVALRIRLRVREADALGRSGSDGFLAALPHTDEAGAATFADALRHRLALRPIGIGDSAVSVTVSIGVATMRPGEDLDVDGMLARVQEALDSARRAGGDRIALDRLHGLARLADPHDTDPGDAGLLGS